MKIYIDTNIFYNDWFMKQANFKYLFHYIANESIELLISKVVCEEVANIRKREERESLSKLKSEIKNLAKLLPFETSYNSEVIDKYKYDFISLLQDKCENFQILDYEAIGHTEIVSRALVNKRPFSDGEKGYRDTLIWLSLLKHLKDEDYQGEVIFITNNISDFFEKKSSELSLHKDLLEDIKLYEIKAKIIPCTSLFSFVNDNVDKNEHSVELAKMEVILEKEGLSYFSDIAGSKLTEIFKGTRLADIPLHNLIFSNAETYEGLEDPSLERSQDMGKGNVFVSYTFNIRGVVLALEIPKIDFETHSTQIEKEFYNIDIKENSVLIETGIRPYFLISYIYNTDTQEYSDVSISCERIR